MDSRPIMQLTNRADVPRLLDQIDGLLAGAIALMRGVEVSPDSLISPDALQSLAGAIRQAQVAQLSAMTASILLSPTRKPAGIVYSGDDAEHDGIDESSETSAATFGAVAA